MNDKCFFGSLVSYKSTVVCLYAYTKPNPKHWMIHVRIREMHCLCGLSPDMQDGLGL